MSGACRLPATAERECDLRALVLLGCGRAAVSEFPDPEPGPGEVVVAMRASGVCGSDMHAYRAARDPARQLPSQGIPGHEPCGVVAAIGHGVERVRLGDRVSVYHYRGCGHCRHCRSGFMQWCHEARGYGAHIPGALADYVLTDERNCLPLPEGLSFAVGAYVACGVGTGWSALRKLAPSGTDTLAVFGLGPIGLAAVAMARAMGARVIGIGRRKVRLDIAIRMGADAVVDTAECKDVPAEIRRLCPSGGPNIAYETSGAPEAHQWLVATLARGGRAVFVAPGGGPTVDVGPLIGKQLTLMGSFVMAVHDYWPLVEFLVRNRVPVEEAVTNRFPLEQGPEALALFESGECGKVLIEWGE